MTVEYVPASTCASRHEGDAELRRKVDEIHEKVVRQDGARDAWRYIGNLLVAIIAAAATVGGLSMCQSPPAPPAASHATTAQQAAP